MCVQPIFLLFSEKKLLPTEKKSEEKFYSSANGEVSGPAKISYLEIVNRIFNTVKME